ncbi:restriction modification system DNA specificity domain protein [Eubacterium sp. CAG:603]|mgnify:FL=1|nr:restriction modification system DNA specificity domain protein [Eubacterium sp. CAG:603]
MNAQDLKNSILQLAVQGKLVEQRAEEGIARELLEQINLEKDQLIKDKKIKKSKPLPEITEDEIPFEIPESWEWVRLNVLFEVLNGDRGKNYPAKSTLHHEGIPFISAVNLDGKSVLKDDNLLCLSKEQYDKLGNGKLIKGDVVVCIRGSLGKHGNYPFDVGAIASSLVICRQHGDDEILSEYFMRYLDAPLFFSQIRLYDNGTAQPNLAAKSLEQFLIPLPPLEEQHRIVAKIEKILPYIDQYDKAYTKLETFNKKFPENMKKSILQMAMQGKLVEQRPEEGTADGLYEQIVAEKAQLIKDGKIKKEKPLLEIAEDEIPFEIPSSWKWVRLGEISSYAQTKKKISPNDIKDDMWSLDLEDIEKDTGAILNRVCASERKISGDKVIFEKGNILYSKLRPYLLKILVASDDGICTPELVPFDTYGEIYNRYIMWVLRAPFVNFAVNAVSYGVKMPRVGTETMVNLLVPLPPLEEQKRIVAKIEELLPYCDQLIK